MQPFQADLDWRAIDEMQAGELQQKLGSLPGNVVAVGHSNGGIVARQWSRNRSVGAIITLGSPNQGAPFVDHIFEWFTFLDDILGRMANVSAAFSVTSHDVWWWVPDRWLDSFNFAADVWNTAGNGFFSLGFDYKLPVMPEMRVFSSYMSNLNSQAKRDAKRHGPKRATSQCRPATSSRRALSRSCRSGQLRQAWHNTIMTSPALLLDVTGGVHQNQGADGQDQTAFDLADQVSSVAEWFLQFEDVWC